MHKVVNQNRLFTRLAALALAVSWLTLLLSYTYAQAGTSTVRGTVVDHQGAAVPGATVSLQQVGKDFTRTQTTKEDGGYVFKAVPAHKYNIQVEAAGFKQSLIPDVNSKPNLAVVVDIKLEAYSSEISKDAPARARVTDIRPPIVRFRPASYLSMCGARSYVIKDSAGGYLMFTMHTEDMPHPLTVDNPLLSPESWLSVDPASTFANERPPDGAERKLLVKLLQQWRDSSIPEQKLRRFEHYAGLKDDAAINKVLTSLSKTDSDWLSLWFVVRELEQGRK